MILDDGPVSVVVVTERWWADEPLHYDPLPPAPRKAAPPRASRAATVPKHLTAAPAAPRPGWVERFGRCVIEHESNGNPRAENPTSTASGLFQFIDGTWQAWTRRSGIGTQYGHASHAPASVQWAVFSYAVRHHAQHAWRGTHCGYGT